MGVLSSFCVFADRQVSMTELHSMDRKLRVAVLMGGTSSERAISLSTGKMILNALDPERYEVTAIDTRDLLALSPSSHLVLPANSEPSSEESAADRDIPAESGDRSLAVSRPEGERLRPDVVFIALHGKGGEDGTVQGMLEMLGLPYTGSGVLASALAMDKAMAKRLFRAEGIPVIDAILVRKEHRIGDTALIARVQQELGSFPVFVKPNAEGSTFGCSLVTAPEHLAQAVAAALEYDNSALIERYVRGMEITAGVLGNAGQPL